MKELFNEYVKSIDTYIMFKIKQEATKLTPELVAKNRAPIALAMGAPVAPPPQFVYDKLIEALNINQIHTYSSPKGESWYLEAISKRMLLESVCSKMSFFSILEGMVLMIIG